MAITSTLQPPSWSGRRGREVHIARFLPLTFYPRFRPGVATVARNTRPPLRDSKLETTLGEQVDDRR